MKLLFSPGQAVMTKGVADLIKNGKINFHDITKIFERHITGDWGDLCESDKDLNEAALDKNNPQRLFSAYHINSIKFYIITEWDRSITTVLLPEEY